MTISDKDLALPPTRGFGPRSTQLGYPNDELAGPSPLRTLAEVWRDAVATIASGFDQQRATPYFAGSYEAYLKTDHWLVMRQRMLLRAGRMCQRCFRTTLHLDVHHRDYRHLGAEREADLIVLCRECHTAEHGGMS